ncbi:hypothetical protein GMA19_03911 [Paenibacillus polymyxa E681]|nr:hypothetical protein GE561_03913 [Paenibacillus polymyxa E681]QNV63558.1 hypothetical protein GMA19_03911 [Paenibacillus polymyxa E681]
MGSTIRLRSGTKVTFKFHLYIRSALLLFTVVFAFFNALSKFVQSTRSDNDLK